MSESKPGKLVRLEQLSGSLNAVEEQTDLVRGERRDASTWTLMGFHKRSSFKQWQGLGCDYGAALAASSLPIPSSGSLANRQAFVYGHYLDSTLKALYNHQILEYYCEGMLGRWLQVICWWLPGTFPKTLKPWIQLLTILSQQVEKFYLRIISTIMSSRN